MMKINLLKCFPHRFTKHYDRKSCQTYALCLRCGRRWEIEADYRTPHQKWYEFVDNMTNRMGLE